MPADMNGNASGTGIHACFRLEQGGFILDVDLHMPGRGVTALFGPSGSGKTSLLRCLAGLATPRSGYLRVNREIWLDTERGHAVPSHRRAVGYVFQDANLFPHLDVRANLHYGYARVAKAERKVQPDDAVALLGIGHLLQRRPASLSGGERQRVGIARALLTSPRLLLMDEPLAALDDRRKQEILPYLERLHDELDIPVVYVSHAVQEVARLADHVVLMEEGRAIGSGPIGATFADLRLPPALAQDAAVVVRGVVDNYDAVYRLLAVALPGGAATLRVVHDAVPPGRPMRLVVKARDVSLALSRQQDGSTLNVLPARVESCVPADNPAHVMVRLDADGTPLLARITRYSHDQLALAAGKQVWAQIKSVSLLA
ncbi:molybdenum ABC transporter ATP-binding protein [Bordetella flabilis]|uniref:Molybdenum ABC transporter ATP-binding protein n=1 Tax=Bordetella flabilis TaxID=463014 RepID=A0A193GDM1_9BORD|nr:molybdenum ABC transporter ATP-binding protein [Bordetella flabilis]ANN78132.1 molybdenum ABC transporter ATP-binding protein [Bordetella flabilis]